MKIEVKKFGEILTSRPAGHEAGLAIKPEPGDPLELDFSGVLAMGPSWLDEVLTVLRSEHVICLPSENASVSESLKMIDTQRGV